LLLLLLFVLFEALFRHTPDIAKIIRFSFSLHWYWFAPVLFAGWRVTSIMAR